MGSLHPDFCMDTSAYIAAVLVTVGSSANFRGIAISRHHLATYDRPQVLGMGLS